MTTLKMNLNTTINKIINKIEKFESKKIQLSAKYISETHFSGGKLFLFGTGHNHCLAEEGLHRAGGYANACPILDDNINFAKGIKKASKAERTAGISKSLLNKYKIQENDTLIIFTNSGVNKAPIEAATLAKKIGAKVIVVLSLSYCNSIKEKKNKIFNIADITIYNHGPIGDTLVTISKNIKVASPSIITGSYILNSILLNLAKLLKKEKPFPFYISSNQKGANKHNALLEKKYSSRNKFLK
jgi:uncharacterized phosphosugar-binding protein